MAETVTMILKNFPRGHAFQQIISKYRTMLT